MTTFAIYRIYTRVEGLTRIHEEISPKNHKIHIFIGSTARRLSTYSRTPQSQGLVSAVGSKNLSRMEVTSSGEYLMYFSGFLLKDILRYFE